MKKKAAFINLSILAIVLYFFLKTYANTLPELTSDRILTIVLSTALSILPFIKVWMPTSKTFWLMPNFKWKQFFSIFKGTFFTLPKGYVYIISVVVYVILFYDSSKRMPPSIFIHFFIYLLFLAVITSWTFRVSLNLFKGYYLLLSTIAFVLLAFSYMYIPLNFYFYWVVIGILLSCFFVYMVFKIHEEKFEVLFLKRGQRRYHYKYGKNILPVYFKKELRMIYRTKRLRQPFSTSVLLSLVYIFSPFLFGMEFKKFEFSLKYMVLYIVLCPFMLVPISEYFSLFWCWDKSYLGSILVLPKQKRKYVYGKYQFCFFSCILVFIFHFIYFSFLDFYLSSFLISLGTIFLITYRSFFRKRIPNILYIGPYIYYKGFKAYIDPILVLYPSILISWYGIIIVDNRFLKLVPFLIVFALAHIFYKKMLENWRTYEWKS